MPNFRTHSSGRDPFTGSYHIKFWFDGRAYKAIFYSEFLWRKCVKMPDSAGGRKMSKIRKDADEVTPVGDGASRPVKGSLSSLLAYQILRTAKSKNTSPREVLARHNALVASGRKSPFQGLSTDPSKLRTASIEVTASGDVHKEIMAMREMVFDGMIEEKDALYALYSRFPSSSALVRKLWQWNINDLRAFVHLR